MGLKMLSAVALLLVAVAVADAARILAVMPMPARSHHIAVSAITKALADKGHDVTYVTGLDKGNKIHPTNHKLIQVGNPLEAGMKEELKNFWNKPKSPFALLASMSDMGVTIVNSTLSHPAFLAEVNKPGQKYDLIVIEAFFFQEGFVGLGHKFNAQVVAVNPFGTSPMINEIMGNPVNPSWVPSPFLGFSDRMAFLERAMNTILHVFGHVFYEYYNIPKQQEVVSKYFPDAPALSEMLRTKIGLTLVNNHFSLVYPMPMSPNVVEIGGLHIPEKTKPLPKDLQDYLDASKEGVLYFSMGSNLKVQDMPKPQKDAILGALGALKIRVLLKWDGPTQDLNLPANIRVIEWAPQADLLAHPNIRAFFTHGGLLSTQETVYHGVPLIGMPMFGDQQFNMMLAERKGFCVKVDFHTMTKDSLLTAINEVLQNPKYKQAASKLSRLFRSKVVSPKQAAVFAVEHVLEHGADHLRPSSVGMPLYQLLLLDVLLAGVLVVALPVMLLLACCRALCCGKKKADGAASRRKKIN